MHKLSPAERRILYLIAQGETTREIAKALFISPKTVENHRLNIADKLDVHGQNALLRFALQHRGELELLARTEPPGPSAPHYPSST